MVYYYAKNKHTGEAVKGYNRDVPFYESIKGLKLAINRKLKLNKKFYDKNGEKPDVYPTTMDGYSIHTIEVDL